MSRPPASSPLIAAWWRETSVAVILDCCHSGSGTREIKTVVRRARTEFTASLGEGRWSINSGVINGIPGHVGAP